MGRADIEAGEFAALLFGKQVEGHARHRVSVDLEQVIIVNPLFDGRPGSAHQFVGGDRSLGEQEDAADVLFQCAADLLIFVGVNQGANAFVGEYFREQTVIHAAVDDVNARNAGVAGIGGVARLGDEFGSERPAFEDPVEVGDEHLADESAFGIEPVPGGDEDEFDGAERLGEFDGHGIGIDAIGFAVAVESERRHDGNDAFVQQGLEQRNIDALDAAGVEVIDALQDAHGMSDDGVGTGRAQVTRIEAFEHFMGEAICGRESQPQRAGVRDTGTFEIGGAICS
jgi:hypothetical protein